MRNIPVKKSYGKYSPIYVYDNNYHQTTLEEQIQLQYEKIIEWELRQPRFKCHYKTKTTKAGEMLEAEIYPCFLDRKDYTRAKKLEKTNKAQKKQNDKNAQRIFVRKANTNFTTGDFMLTAGFTLENQPKNLDDCIRLLNNYISRLRYHMEKAGREGGELKYMYVIEMVEQKNGALHYHIHFIFNSVAGSNNKGVDNGYWLKKKWTGGKRSRVDYLEIEEIGGLTGLSTYMTKQFEDEKGLNYLGENRKRWGSSENLKKSSEKPTESFRKFDKKRVAKLLKAPATMKEVFEKEYPDYAYWEKYPCEVRYSEVIDGYYLYCRMYKRRN